MRRILLIVICLFPIIALGQESKQNNQTDQPGDFFFTLSSGVSANLNASKEIATSKFSFENKGPRYNISMGLGMMATKHWRPRLEFRYERLAYGQKWQDASNSYSSFDYTTVKVNYMDINLHFDYLLFHSKSGWIVFLSPAIKTEYAVGASYKTQMSDGSSTHNNYSEIDDYYPKSIAGGSFSFIFKYDLNSMIGLTFSPEYTHFFRPFQLSNSSKYQRLNFNLGVEFHIH